MNKPKIKKPLWKIESTEIVAPKDITPAEYDAALDILKNTKPSRNPNDPPWLQEKNGK